MLSRKQSQFYSSYCGSSEKVITLALQASIASSNLVSRTKSHTFYPLKLVGQSMAWLSHARWTTILKSMKDCQQAVCLAPSWLTHTCQCSRHELTDGKQPSHVKRQTKSGVYGCFSLHPSPAPRLCVNSSSPVGVAKHRLILFRYFVLNVFEYMPYFPYLDLSILTKICGLIWIYVVLPFNQTYVFFNPFIFSLNMCRITFLLKLTSAVGVESFVWMYVVLPFYSNYRPKIGRRD